MKISKFIGIQPMLRWPRIPVIGDYRTKMTWAVRKVPVRHEKILNMKMYN